MQGFTDLSTKKATTPLEYSKEASKDYYIAVFFKDWAPLFPVLHKPTYLKMYKDFSAPSKNNEQGYQEALIILVFSIAMLSHQTSESNNLPSYENEWVKALEPVASEVTIETLQCFILALLYCSIRSNHTGMLHYRSIAVGLAHRLGLCREQTELRFDYETLQTRR